MKNGVGKSVARGGLLFLTALFVGGCACTVRRYDVEVSLDESLRDHSIIVDLVGVNPSKLPILQNYPLSKYWDPNGNDQMREDAIKRTLNFVSGQTLTNKLSSKDVIWKQWKDSGVTHVMVFADLDPAGLDLTRVDPRRLDLDLHRCTWPAHTSELVVHVQGSGMAVTPPPLDHK